LRNRAAVSLCNKQAADPSAHAVCYREDGSSASRKAYEQAADHPRGRGIRAGLEAKAEADTKGKSEPAKKRKARPAEKREKRDGR
jgi:hypothetical protein